MKQAWSAADTTLLRTRPQRATWYLAVHKPRIVLSASAIDGISSFPLSAIEITPISGVQADVKKGMTLRLGTTIGGSTKGILRVRGGIDSFILPVAESGSGLLKGLATNDVITVMDQYLPWSIHPQYDAAASAWIVDYETYTSQLDQYGPYVNIGPPVAEFIDPVSGSTATKYWGSNSLNFGDATIDTVSWDFPDGLQSATLGTPGTPVSKQYPDASPSGSYAALTITDTNGVSSIGQRLNFVFDDRTQPYKVSFGEIAGGIRDGGYKTQIRVHGSAVYSDFPDMSEVVIFEEASYGATASTLGGNFAYRSNIVFRGWLDGKTVTMNPFTGDVMFQANTINRMMDRLDSQDVFLISKVSPTITGASGWLGASALTADRSAYNLLKNRSTISTITDFYPAEGLASKTGLMLYSDLARQSLWKQFSKIYREQGNYGFAAADMQSSLFGINDAQITGGSAALPLTEIAKQDRRDAITIQERDYDENSDVHFLSIASDVKVWTRSPGDVGAYYGRKKEHSRGMYADQHTMTQWVGNWRALLNSKFPKVKIPLSGNIRLDSVPQSRISMSLSATDNVRGYSWDDKEFLPHKTRLVYNSQAGVVLSELEVEEVVQGVGGSAVTFPDITTIPTKGDPKQEDQPDIPGDTEGDGFGTAYVMLSTGLARTRDLSVASPIWTDIESGLSGTFHDFILDPWNPTTRAFILTTAGVFRGTDMDASAPTWTSVLSIANILDNTDGNGVGRIGPKIQMSINVENYIGLTVETTTGATNDWGYYIYSTDAGDTWNYILVRNISAISDAEVHMRAWDIVPHSSDGNLTIYLVVGTKANLNEALAIYKSANSGATWSLIQNRGAAGNGPQPTCCNTPYKNNESGNEVWISVRNGGIDSLRKTTDGFATWPSAIDLPGTANDYTDVKRLGIEIYVGDNNRVVVWTSGNELFKSTNGGNSWSEISYSGYVPGTHGTVSGGGGFPFISSQYYMVTDNRYVFVSIDGGSTWIEKTGNLQSIITVNGSVFDGGIVRLGVIVPVWVAE